MLRFQSAAAIWLVLFGTDGFTPAREGGLRAGQAVADITPALDVNVEAGGTAFLPGQPRKYTGIRQIPEARCLLLRAGETSAVIVSLDLLGVGKEFCDRVRAAIAARTQVPAAHVRVCATHTHSMPSFKKLRFHGELPVTYMARVEKAVVEAAVEAEKDLAPARLEVGAARAPGASFNRTAPTWKTDEAFGKDSTDADRWLDTTVHVLRFRRQGDKPDLLWYHFSAHPVCHRDDEGAGPDWPGLVNRMIASKYRARPSFLQGHCGDVNPGDGKTFLGKPEDMADKVFAAIDKSRAEARRIDVKDIGVVTGLFALPLDLKRLTNDIQRFEADPEQCVQERGWYKNLAFARDWHAWATKWDRKQTSYPVTLSVLRLGEVALVFHPGELYSGYGLAVRRDSPFRYTLAVGYTDDLVGYLPDPRAFAQSEYAAVTVPKLLDLPPFTPNAARELSQAAGRLLQKASQP